MEASAIEHYSRALDYFESRLGKGVTMENELDAEGKDLCGSFWGGVFARDEGWSRRLDDPGEHTRLIVNLDKRNSSMGGSHWVAVCRNREDEKATVYDSFGRTHVLGYLDHLLDADRDAEQKVIEDNCGQRCLAFIQVFQELGPEAARMI